MDTGRSRQGSEGFQSPQSPLDATGMRRRRRSYWNPASWSPGGSSFAPNPSYRALGTPGGREFASTEHLAPEAVAAFVDGELAMSPHMRAARHLGLCAECAAAVEAQVTARTRLRTSGSVEIPASLLGQLSQIPTREFDVPPAGAEAPPAASGFPVHDAPPALGDVTGWASRRWGR